jgi:hypothetical protein
MRACKWTYTGRLDGLDYYVCSRCSNEIQAFVGDDPQPALCAVSGWKLPV